LPLAGFFLACHPVTQLETTGVTKQVSGQLYSIITIDLSHQSPLSPYLNHTHRAKLDAMSEVRGSIQPKIYARYRFMKGDRGDKVTVNLAAIT
jgi:hypothetical protein